MRFIPFGVPRFEDLGLPEVIGTLAREERGVILVTGTTGSDKSTTLASMLDLVNRTVAKQIVTIEEPIEFLHRDDKSIINQHEVGSDTVSYTRALKRVLRQDPDIILISVRSGTPRARRWCCRRWIRAPCVEHAAHAGRDGGDQPHDRPVPAARARAGAGDAGGHLAGHRGAASDEDQGRAGAVAVCEIMVATGRIRDFIMDPGQTQTAVSEGEYYGMQTFDQALLKLIEDDRVTYGEALQIASRPQDFRLMVQSLGLDVARRH